VRLTSNLFHCIFLISIRWKHTVTRKIQSIESFLDLVRDRLSIPRHEGIEDFGKNGIHPMRADDESSRISTSPVATEPRTWEVRMDPETGPAAIPASVVGEVPSPEISASGATSYDLITKEIVTLDEAQSLFDVYAYRLDHYLYRILGDSPSLESIRSSSSLLLAAVCTVGSLHSPTLGSLFDRCYRKFIDLAAARTFAKDHNIGDIKALCIGAFWLHEVSWTLIGQGLSSSLYQVNVMLMFVQLLELQHNCNYIEASTKLLLVIKKAITRQGFITSFTCVITTSQFLTVDHQWLEQMSQSVQLKGYSNPNMLEKMMRD